MYSDRLALCLYNVTEGMSCIVTGWPCVCIK